MSKQQKKREPFLFIQQPKLQPPQVKMQESYSIKQAEKKRQEELKLQKKLENNTAQTEKKKKSKKRKEELPPSPEEVQETIEEYHEEKAAAEEEKNEYGLRRLKPFREMEIQERIDYLSNFPKRLPPVPCLFRTIEKEWKGTLLEKKDKEIVIRLFDNSEEIILIKDLVEVRMVGLR